MAIDAILEMLDRELAARESAAAGGSFVFLPDTIDENGSEPDGLVEFDRRGTEMRSSGALKPGDTLIGTIIVAAPLRDPEQTRREEQRAAATIRAYETEHAPAASTESPQATRPRGFRPGDRIDNWPSGSIA